MSNEKELKDVTLSINPSPNSEDTVAQMVPKALFGDA